MTKNLKLNIKNPQIAGAINLGGLKAKLAKQKGASEEEVPSDTVLAGEKAAEKAVKTKKKLASKPETKPDSKSESKGESKADLESVQAEKKKKPLRPKTKEEAEEKETSHAKVEEKTLIKKQSVEKIEPAQKAASIEKPEPVKEPSKAVSKPVSVESPVAAVSDTAISPTSIPPKTVQKPAPQAVSRPAQPPRAFPQKESYSRERETRYSGGAPTSRFAPFKPQPFQPQGGVPRPRETDQGDHRSFVRPTPMPPRRPASEQGGHPESARPQGDRPQGDRPQYSQGDRPQGDRPQYSQGDRPQYGQGSRPPYQGDRPPSSRPPYQGDRPGGFRPPYQQGPRPPYQPGQRPPYQQGQRPPYQQGQRPPYQQGGAYQPRREGGAPPPRGFSGPRPMIPPPIKEGEFRKVPDDEQKRTRHDFGEAASKFQKGKLKDSTAPKVPRKEDERSYDVRTRHGFVSVDEEAGGAWRSRRRPKMMHSQAMQEIVRPTKIKIRLPISIKDLALEMKLKASELVSKLFIQGMVVTLNDVLDDAVAVALLGHEFGCEVTIDTAEAERIRISDKNVREEISAENPDDLAIRPPVVAFMGHVDHGKTSLVDAIRKSNRAAKEVGAITQHIGAFTAVTPQGTITILDTPGHEAFTLMRERGATITDIVVLVVAGDEGIQEQTKEAIKQARNAGATIVVALTKCDKPNFDAETVYRQLADQELLPEIWGGQTVTVNCSAVTGQGVQELLEMLALQSEVLELRANPKKRARGTVIESQMQQGLGSVATVLIQNGTLHVGDSLVFGEEFARIKSMRNENGAELKEASPSTPVLITGLSGLPEAGEEFIVVKNEKEAKEIAEVRREGKRQSGFQLKKRATMESLMETAAHIQKKSLTLILRADVQGSLEALVKALEKTKSDKVEINIISQGVGQISESDVQLGFVSNATIIGFHTSVEAHAESIIKEMGVKISLQNIIYHVVDYVKVLMKGLLDKLPEEVEKGKAEVKEVFKSSHLGVIAGCQVIEGTITRNSQIRVKRNDELVWKGSMSSLKRVKEDVKEVQKGIECGILLAGFSDTRVGDILEAYDIIYVDQEL